MIVSWEIVKQFVRLYGKKLWFASQEVQKSYVLKNTFVTWKIKKQTIEILSKIKALLVDSTSLKSGKNKKQY